MIRLDSFNSAQNNNIPKFAEEKYTQQTKSGATNSSPFSSFSTYKTIPLDQAKAYASPQIAQGYREIGKFKVPYIGNGKMYELSNGHKIILINKLGPTSIHTSVKAGNLNEPANQKETSHLLEHLLANYSFKPSIETKDILTKTGAMTNASTLDLITDYYIKAPITKAQDFEDLIKIQAGTLKNTNFTPEQIEDEKNIIIQELNSKEYYTQNYLLAERLATQNLFNLQDSDSIISPSSDSTVKNINKTDLINYYNAFYKPQNMTTAIVGEVDDNSIKTVAKYFGEMQTPEITSKTEYPKISTNNLIKKTIRKDVRSLDKNEEKAYIDLSFIGPKNSNDDSELIQLNALKEAVSEKISEYEREKDTTLDFTITSNMLSLDKNVPNVIRVSGTDYDVLVEDDLKVIYSILYGLSQKPISEEELNLIKNRMNDNTDFTENSLALATVKSRQGLLSKNLDGEKEASSINSIKAEDIQNIAKKYLDLNKASLVVVHPLEKTDKTETAKTVSFKGNIDLKDTKDIHEYVLPNNLRVVIDSRPGISKTTIKFDLQSKKTLYNNPEASSGLAYFLASKETEQKMSDDGISLAADGNSQQIYTKLNGRSDKTLEMLSYATGILLNPAFSSERFDELKKLLSEDEDYISPKKSARDKIEDEWRKESPYLTKPGAIKDLEFADIKNLHQQILQNAQGTVFITIPKEELEKVQGEIFQTLTSLPNLQVHDQNVIFNKYKPMPFEKTKIFTEEKDSGQIEIEKVFKIIESGNIQDRAGLMILNNILGGDNTSKLFKYLRTEDKIAYDVDSAFSFDSSNGNLSKITLSTKVAANNNNLRKVVSEYDKSINELITQPISQDELDKAKTKLKSMILEDLESSSSRNELVSGSYNSFYGINHQKELIDAIDKMTPQYLQELAKCYLTQPYMMAICGSKDIIESNKEYLSTLGEISRD